MTTKRISHTMTIENDHYTTLKKLAQINKISVNKLVSQMVHEITGDMKRIIIEQYIRACKEILTNESYTIKQKKQNTNNVQVTIQGTDIETMKKITTATRMSTINVIGLIIEIYVDNKGKQTCTL